MKRRTFLRVGAVGAAGLGFLYNRLSKECLYQPPKPIFYKELTDDEYGFRQKGNYSVELFTSGGLTAFIVNDGCDCRTQEYHFIYKNDRERLDERSLVRNMLNNLYSFSRLGAEFHTYREWPNAIYSTYENITTKKVVNTTQNASGLNQTLELAEGFYGWMENNTSREYRGNSVEQFTIVLSEDKKKTTNPKIQEPQKLWNFVKDTVVKNKLSNSSDLNSNPEALKLS